MGQVSNAATVDFPAYCKAFEVFTNVSESRWTSAVCAKLDPDPDYYSIGTLYRDEKGDGVVRVPQYGITLGKTVERGSRLLLEDGRVIIKDKRGERSVAEADPEFAAYFIAGAFGMGELKDASNLDDAIVSGVQELYRLCVQDADSCLDSAPARKISSAWRGILDARAEVRAAQKQLGEKKAAMGRLQAEYDRLAATVVDKQSLVVGVAPYKSRMPVDLVTMQDCDQAERLIKEMIVVAQAVMAGDEKRAEAESKSARLAMYRQENPTLLNKISDAENKHGYHWRFTNAFKAAMACMPAPSDAEDAYCVERNKYEMGTGLQARAHDFPARSVCDGRWVPENEHCSGRGDSRSCTTTGGYCEGPSHIEGRDYDEEELVSFAKGYCSTQCR